MLDPYILSPVLNSLSFGILEFHLRMRQICRPKLYNYPYFIVWCSKKPVFTVYLWCLNIRRLYYYINTYEFIFTFGSLHERLFLV
jgi:hypothetical protein